MGWRGMLSHSSIHICSECTEHPLFLDCGERTLHSAAPDIFAALCAEWKGMDYGGFVSCKASSSILLLVQNAQGDLILERQRQVIRACTIFLLCVGRAVEPCLQEISWFCEVCCLHLQIVPKCVSALSVPLLPFCYLHIC